MKIITENTTPVSINTDDLFSEDPGAYNEHPLVNFQVETMPCSWCPRFSACVNQARESPGVGRKADCHTGSHSGVT